MINWQRYGSILFVVVSTIGILFAGVALPLLAQTPLQPPPPVKGGLILTQVTNTFNNPLKPGENSVLFFEASNTSNTLLTGIRFSISNLPKGWTVGFKPDRIDVLVPNSFQTIEIDIMPSGQATKGDYNITVIANSNEIPVRVLDIFARLEVETDLWIWVGGALGIGVITAFVFIFLRINRQQRNNGKQEDLR